MLPYNQKVLMGQEGRKKVEKEFDRSIVIDAYLKALNELNEMLKMKALKSFLSLS